MTRYECKIAYYIMGCYQQSVVFSYTMHGNVAYKISKNLKIVKRTDH